MTSLFFLEPQFPPGFTYYPEFISREEETLLLKGIGDIELHPFQFHGYEGKRRVESFGYDYSFEKKALSKGKPIPEGFAPLMEKVANQLSIDKQDFAELLVTEYPVGAVINWHRDAPPFDIIAGISLHADCVFRLRPQEKEKRNRRAIISLTVEPRSLYVIRDEARSEWQHSTKPVERVRYSITLRTLRK